MAVVFCIYLLNVAKTESIGNEGMREDLKGFEPEIKTIGSYFTYAYPNVKRNVDVKDHNEYCRSFQSCEECASSGLSQCGWCHNFGCIAMADTMCPASKTRNLTNANQTCPAIYLPTRPKGPLLLHIGRIEIKVKIRITDPVIYHKVIVCQIMFSDTTKHFRGWIEGDEVHCQPFIDTNSRGHDVATLEIIWGGVKPFSNEIPLILYDCEELGKGCGMCEAIPREYECGWCTNAGRCKYKDRCKRDTWIISDNLDCRSVVKTLRFV